MHDLHWLQMTTVNGVLLVLAQATCFSYLLELLVLLPGSLKAIQALLVGPEQGLFGFPLHALLLCFAH